LLHRYAGREAGALQERGGAAGRRRAPLERVVQRIVVVQARIEALARVHERVDLELVQRTAGGIRPWRELHCHRRGGGGDLRRNPVRDARRPIEEDSELVDCERGASVRSNRSTRLENRRERRLLTQRRLGRTCERDSHPRDGRSDWRRRIDAPREAIRGPNRLIVTPAAAAGMKQQVVEFPRKKGRILVFEALSRVRLLGQYSRAQ
jgi:hypothetical protein